MTLPTVEPSAARRAPEHTVAAECSVCQLAVELLPGRDVHACLQSFRTAHPMTAALPHERLVPDGWWVPLSGPGAWSQ